MKTETIARRRPDRCLPDIDELTDFGCILLMTPPEAIEDWRRNGGHKVEPRLNESHS